MFSRPPPNNFLTGRRVARGAATGGIATHEERQAFAEAPPAERARIMVRIAEEQRGGARMPAWAIRKVEAEARAYAEAVGAIAAEREREEQGDVTEFSLDEIADATAQKLR